MAVGGSEDYMKILHLPIHEGGVAYYRHHLPTMALRRAGHTVLAAEDALPNWLRLCDFTSHEGWLSKQLEEGVDIIHGGWSNNLYHIELLVAAREKSRAHLLIDFDDDVLNIDKYNLSYMHYHEGNPSRRVARLGMRVADGVTTSTVPLQESMKPEARFTAVLPNFVNTADWQDFPVDRERPRDRSVRVMFAGGPSHLGDVTQVKEAVEWVISHYDGKDERPHVKVIFFACMPDWAAHYVSDSHIATANRCFYISATGNDVALWQRCIRWVAPDILVAPLLHHQFNRSKSLIKAYDAAMVEGCAFACEAWPAYDDVPADAASHVDSTREGAWQETLQALIENADLRHELSAALRAWVLDKRTIDANINLWEAAYQQALDRPIVSALSDIVRPRILAPSGKLARELDD